MCVLWTDPYPRAHVPTPLLAGKLLEQIAELVLNNNVDMADRVGKNNQESFWLKHTANNGTHSMAKINSYPSCAKTLRGSVPRPLLLPCCCGS